MAAARVQAELLVDGTPDQVRKATDAALRLLDVTPPTVPWSVKRELMVRLGEAAAQAEQQELSAQLERSSATTIQAAAGKVRSFLERFGVNLPRATRAASWAAVGFALHRHGVATSVEPSQRGALDALLQQAKPHLSALSRGGRAETQRAVDAVMTLLSTDVARALPVGALQPVLLPLVPAVRALEPS